MRDVEASRSTAGHAELGDLPREGRRRVEGERRRRRRVGVVVGGT
jgi:hypothetical protein